jgi:hypothetical protein
MSHVVLCPYCNTKFDRDKEEYAVIGTRRYSHASCMLREVQKNSNYKKKEIINPLDNVICVFCKKPLSKKDADCVMIGEGKYAHAECQKLESTREKTEKELLDDYIKELFQVPYIDAKVRKQINSFIEKFNYTYSGIRKALIYHYEIKGGDKSKANGGIGIVPYVYQDAYNYHYNLWLAQEKNKNIQVETYAPKIKNITILKPERKVKERKLFTFLDEEE